MGNGKYTERNDLIKSRNNKPRKGLFFLLFFFGGVLFIMVKKLVPLLLALVILATFVVSPAAFADRNYNPGDQIDLGHPPGSGGGSNSGGGSRPPSGGGGSGSHNGGGGSGGGGGGGTSNSNSTEWVTVEELLKYGGEYCTWDTTTSTKTLYYRWYKSSGPGTMTMHASNGPIRKTSDGYHAGNRVTVSFNKAGRYKVFSEHWTQDVIKTTTETWRDATYRIWSFLVPKNNPLLTSGKADLLTYLRLSITSNSYTVTREQLIDKTVETQTKPPKMASRQPHDIYVTDPEKPITLPEQDKHLVTTANASFNRQYLYTEKNLDAKTWKPFEVEVTFTLSTNSKITKVGKPYHIITRYQNNGTMTVSPVEFKILSGGVGSSSVTYRAKFKYTKAGMPNKSPIYFPVTVNTKQGPFTPVLYMDAPVNTLNGRFIELPDNQHGEVYPIKIDPNHSGWGTVTWQRTVN